MSKTGDVGCVLVEQFVLYKAKKWGWKRGTPWSKECYKGGMTYCESGREWMSGDQ